LTTYLFIGLILLLVVYLVRSRRGKPAADPSPARPARARAFPRPSLKLRRSASPHPAPAPAPRVQNTPRAAAAALDSMPGARPSPPATFLDWTPAETIMEPGWPLPGEISGGWATSVPAPDASPVVDITPFPDGPPSPIPAVEWAPSTDSGPLATPVNVAAEAIEARADLPAAEEWTMPPMDPPPSEETGDGPPLWVPEPVGVEVAAAAEVPVLHRADEEPAWVTGPPPAPLAPEAPALGEWRPEPPAADENPASEWAPEPAAPPAYDSIWLSEPGADGSPGAEAESAEGAEAPEAPEAPEADALETEPSAPEDPVLAWTDAPSPAWAEAPSATWSDDPAPADEAAEAAPDAFVPMLSWTDPGTASAPVDAAPPGEIAPGGEEPIEEQSVTIAGLLPSLLDGLVPFTRVCDRPGVTPRMLSLLRILAETPLSVTEQAHRLGVSRPLVADLCARLEGMSLVGREQVESDRRRSRIALTEAGHHLVMETEGSPEPTDIEAVLARLTPAERVQLLNGLEALAAPSPGS